MKMSILGEINDFAAELEPNADQQEIIHKILVNVEEILSDNPDYSIAELWKTSEINLETELGKKNIMDIIVLIHTTESERDLYKVFASFLEGKTEIKMAHPGVAVAIDDFSFHIVPTKFAAQGSIRIEDKDFPYFSTIVGEDEQFRTISRLLQYWQFKENLEIPEHGLLPFEIELILAYLFRDTRPEDIMHGVHMFFDFISKSRLSKQINVFDRYHNILLYHDFKLRDKQFLIRASDNALEKMATGSKLTVF